MEMTVFAVGLMCIRSGCIVVPLMNGDAIVDRLSL
jgi:hypothetical protein